MSLPSIHMRLAERREIARMHAAKIPISVIADRLRRHRSTIDREIKRNRVHDEEPLSRHGRPLAFYCDKHSIFRVSKAQAQGGQEA